MEKNNEKGKNIVIGILSVLLIISIIYIGYEKLLKKESNNIVNNCKSISNETEKNKKIDFDFENLLNEAIEIYTPFTIYDYDAKLDLNNCKTIKNQKYCLDTNKIFSSKSELEDKITKIFGNQSILHNQLTIVGDSKYGWANLYEETDGKYYKLVNAPMKKWNGANYSNVVINKVEPIVIDDEKVLLNVYLTSEKNPNIDGSTEFKTNLYYLLLKKDNNWTFEHFETPMGRLHNEFNETSLSFDSIYVK